MTWPGEPTFRSRRCVTCDINWPRGTGFDQCPGCDGYTESSTNVPLDAGPAADLVTFLGQERERLAAESRSNHEAFERYVAERDEAVVIEFVAALALLPTTPSWLDVPPSRTTPNFGLAGGELGC